MKLISIMIMALLLAVVGHAQNYMPEFTMEPGAGIEMDSTTPGDIEMWGGNLTNATIVGNVSYVDGGSNVQEFNFSDEPTDGDFFTSIGDIWSLVEAKFISDVAVVGPASDTWSIFYDWTTDGIDDAVEIELALADNKAVKLVNGPFYISNNSIDIDEAQRRLYSDGSEVELISDSGATNPIINLTASQCTIERLLLNGNKSESVEGQHGISWTSGNQNTIRQIRTSGIGDDAIHIAASGNSLGASGIEKCYLWNSYGNGIDVDNSPDLRIVNTEVGASHGFQIYLHGENAANIQFDAGHIWGPPATDIALVKTEGTYSAIQLTDSAIAAAYNMSLDLETSGNIVSGCRFGPAAPSHSGSTVIYVTGDWNTITCNFFHNVNVTNAIVFATGADYNQFSLNSLMGAMVVDDGASNQNVYNI